MRTGLVASRWGSWCAGLLLLVAGAVPLHAHTFTTLTGDMSIEGDRLTLTLGLQLLDALAIIEGKSTKAGETLTHSQLIAGSERIRRYLEENVRLRIDGEVVPGSCLGYLPDLIAPPVAGGEIAEFLPDRLPFKLVWDLPKEATAIDIEFALLLDLVGSGVVQTSLHQGDRAQSRMVSLGGSASYRLANRTAPAPASAGPVAPMTREPMAPPVPAVAASAGSADEQVAAPQDATAMSALQLLVMGFHHIVPEGVDHILFVVSLFLISPKPKPLLVQITAFTLAHSVALGLAMAGLVLLPSRLVETLIAASIVVMALENLVMRGVKPWRWMLVFVFGLVHGLGFAGSFASLRLQPGDFARPLLLLNIGIELGQLSVVAICVALTWWAWQREWYTRAIIHPASILIAMIAGWWTIQRAFGLG